MPTATMKFNAAQQIALGAIDGELVRYYGTVSFSAAADTYITGGLLPLAGFDLKSLGPYADRVPLSIYVYSRAGSGWNYQWNNAAGKLKIFSSAAGSGTSADSEVTTATALNALAPNVFTDDVIFEVVFPRR
jgi:hypothetical protein